MCYTLAQSQDSRAARHLDYAIIALLVPSVSLFAGVFIAAMRRSYGEEAEQDQREIGSAGYAKEGSPGRSTSSAPSPS